MESQQITTRRTTAIEWTEHTWNPFVGCSIVSAGCTNCYAMRAASRIEAFGTAAHYRGVTRLANGRPVWSGEVHRASDAGMDKPRGIRGSALIFVNSMSDFFHPSALDAWRLEALGVMLATPRHAYQILTKRPEEMAPFMERMRITEWPGNVWLGVTVERADAVGRIDLLRGIQAAVRFVSFEPLIGPVGPVDLAGIHWAITGGESGPGARPCLAEWVREIRDQCQAQGVALFHKQWGQDRNNPLWRQTPRGVRPPDWVKRQDPHGKGGSALDGRYWKEWPASYHARSSTAA